MGLVLPLPSYILVSYSLLLSLFFVCMMMFRALTFCTRQSVFKRLAFTVKCSNGRCCLLSLSSAAHPASLVSNVTSDKIASNPELEEFMKANFPSEMDPHHEPVIAPHYSKMNSFGTKTEDQMDQESTDAILAATTLGMSIDPALAARNIRPMMTYLRDEQTETNSRRSRSLRYHRLVPGILYGGDPTRGILAHQQDSKMLCKTPWRLIERELDRFHRNFESRVYALTVLQKDANNQDVMYTNSTMEQPELVVPANVQRHPVQEKVYCVNYVRYHTNRPLKLPLVHVNQEESPALKRDGYLLPIERKIECFVEDGAPIPEALELECTGLQFRDVVRRDRLILPPGVRLSDRVLARGDEYIIAVCDGRGRGSDD